jgi:hypothetical protein
MSSVGKHCSPGCASPTRVDKAQSGLRCSVSQDLVDLLHATLRKELASNDRTGQLLGFDLTSHRISLDGYCAQSWPPSSDAREGQIMEVFYLLDIQSKMPSRLQLLYQRKALSRLKIISGKAPVIDQEYVFLYAIIAGVFLFLSLPFLIAAPFAFYKEPLLKN